MIEGPLRIFFGWGGGGDTVAGQNVVLAHKMAIFIIENTIYIHQNCKSLFILTFLLIDENQL